MEISEKELTKQIEALNANCTPILKDCMDILLRIIQDDEIIEAAALCDFGAKKIYTLIVATNKRVIVISDDMPCLVDNYFHISAENQKITLGTDTILGKNKEDADKLYATIIKNKL